MKSHNVCLCGHQNEHKCSLLNFTLHLHDDDDECIIGFATGFDGCVVNVRRGDETLLTDPSLPLNLVFNKVIQQELQSIKHGNGAVSSQDMVMYYPRGDISSCGNSSSEHVSSCGHFSRDCLVQGSGGYCLHCSCGKPAFRYIGHSGNVRDLHEFLPGFNHRTKGPQADNANEVLQIQYRGGDVISSELGISRLHLPAKENESAASVPETCALTQAGSVPSQGEVPKSCLSNAAAILDASSPSDAFAVTKPNVFFYELDDGIFCECKSRDCKTGPPQMYKGFRDQANTMGMDFFGLKCVYVGSGSNSSNRWKDKEYDVYEVKCSELPSQTNTDQAHNGSVPSQGEIPSSSCLSNAAAILDASSTSYAFAVTKPKVLYELDEDIFYECKSRDCKTGPPQIYKGFRDQANTMGMDFFGHKCVYVGSGSNNSNSWKDKEYDVYEVKCSEPPSQTNTDQAHNGSVPSQGENPSSSCLSNALAILEASSPSSSFAGHSTLLNVSYRYGAGITSFTRDMGNSHYPASPSSAHRSDGDRKSDPPQMYKVFRNQANTTEMDFFGPKCVYVGSGSNSSNSWKENEDDVYVGTCFKLPSHTTVLATHEDPPQSKTDEAQHMQLLRTLTGELHQTSHNGSVPSQGEIPSSSCISNALAILEASSPSYAASAVTKRNVFYERDDDIFCECKSRDCKTGPSQMYKGFRNQAIQIEQRSNLHQVKHGDGAVSSQDMVMYSRGDISSCVNSLEHVSSGHFSRDSSACLHHSDGKPARRYIGQSGHVRDIHEFMPGFNHRPRGQQADNANEVLQIHQYRGGDVISEFGISRLYFTAKEHVSAASVPSAPETCACSSPLTQAYYGSVPSHGEIPSSSCISNAVILDANSPTYASAVTKPSVLYELDDDILCECKSRDASASSVFCKEDVGIEGFTSSGHSTLLNVGYRDGAGIPLTRDMGTDHCPASPASAQRSDGDCKSGPPQMYKRFRNLANTAEMDFFGPKCIYVGSGLNSYKSWKENEDDVYVGTCFKPPSHTTVLATQEDEPPQTNTDEIMPQRRLRVVKDFSLPYVQEGRYPPYAGQQHHRLPYLEQRRPAVVSYFPVCSIFFMLTAGIWLFFGGLRKRRKTLDPRKKSSEVDMQKGFKNIKKTCYVGVSLQCYLSLDSLRVELHRVGPLGRCTSTLKKVLYGPGNDISSLVQVLASTAQPIKTHEEGSPIDIFCHVMFKVICEETPTVAGLFGGWRERTKEFSCGFSCPPKQKWFQHIYMIDLPGEDELITDALLGLFTFESPPLVGECPECKCDEDYKVTWKLVGAPIVLVLEVGFQDPSLENSVTFENVMTISNEAFLARNPGDAEMQYQLKGLIERTGKPGFPHFEAYVRRIVGGEERWYHMDDHVVRRSSLNAAIKVKTPEILVYELIKVEEHDGNQ